MDDYIWQHRHDDPRQIALSGAKKPDFPAAHIAAQVAALQKVKSKIPTWYKPGLLFPPGVSLEQCSSEATARFKASLFSGATLADLSGGLGADAFFFSKNFARVLCVESNPAVLDAARHNFEKLGIENVRFQPGTAADFLAKNSDNFDLAYLDPARRDERGGKLFRLDDCSPDILALRDALLARAPRILLKTSPLLDLRLAMEQLRSVSKIWVLALGDEVKEVLYLLERPPAPAPEAVPIVCASIELDASGHVADNFAPFVFSAGEEKSATADSALPLRYLIEPHAVVLKAGAFRSFAARFGLKKLHPNTHLYTTDAAPPADLPGRVFVLEKTCRYDRKALREALPEARANVATRNFQDKPDAVRKKLGLADGGDFYLFAATLADEKRALLICKKMGKN